MIDIIGYIGMILVLCSFLMKDIKWVRIVNMCGALLSMIYGIVTITIPTAALNGALLVINGCFIIHYYIKKKKNRSQDDKD